MTDKSRRGRFQVHLGTAVLLSLVAAGLIGLNTIRHALSGTESANFVYYPLPGTREAALDRSAFTWGLYGWPTVLYVDVRFNAGHTEKHRIELGSVYVGNDTVGLGWNWRGLVVNAIVAFAALAIFAVIIERIWCRDKTNFYRPSGA